MFEKILVANRGEIACRVFRTASRMGIPTVAVYSDADRDALHTLSADEAIRIGPAASAESYLCIEKILEACKTTGANAVHPGYGFLSENKDFATALASEGIVFIGPKPDAIKAMGDKIESKKIAESAGVNTIPGYTGVIADSAHAVELARDIGYPVMLKASAGGGGKGMRVAYDDAECVDGFERATNEARSSFGDDRVFVEKFIEQPRHIEIQLISDSSGNTIYLAERECSIQRRHQKVIEEAPSTFVDEKMRYAMGNQAVALAKAVDYESAGTVEFVVDSDRNFYFLEMNTRLQVEHPVTELITGFDLVELMIRVAAGEKLPFTQEDVRIDGWALEARIYAEDPLSGFLPSTGRLVRYSAPAAKNGVRVDTGIYEGGEISIYYDPMVAKLVTHGINREQAVQRMQSALDEYVINGIAHNISFLNALISHPQFSSGELTTNFIDDIYPDGFVVTDLSKEDAVVFVVAAAAIDYRIWERANKISGQMPGSDSSSSDYSRTVVIRGIEYPSTVTSAEGFLSIGLAGRTYCLVSDWRIGQPLFKAEIDGSRVSVRLQPDRIGYRMSHGGADVTSIVLTNEGARFNRHMREKEPPDLSRFLLSPMPGLLVDLKVSAGDAVQSGQDLVVVEAMKMENVLRASQDTVVKEVLVSVGDSLDVEQAIIEFEQ